ncbi:MAG TPA: nucleotidyltransferase family protein, partial [Bryobacteraceae bacterium]|nr:nucleotidyltransferase family protein [Bryobacteraceae bacterium]
EGRVLEIEVKRPVPSTNWVWGAFKMPGATFLELQRLWLDRGRKDEYIGTLVNAWIAQGGAALAVHAGKTYVDVGTVHGYREALRELGVYT